MLAGLFRLTDKEIQFRQAAMGFTGLVTHTERGFHGRDGLFVSPAAIEQLHPSENAQRENSGSN